jgi:hypothetical protein
MTLEQVRLFFRNFGLETGLESETVSLEKLEKIVKAAVQWHGADFGRYVMDCFIPISEEVKPGQYKLTHYDFDLFHAV